MSGVMWKIVLFAAFTAFIAALIAWYTRETFDPESLRGKKVVICGASTGIGEELAYQYAKLGAQVLLVARREEELQKVVSKCGKLGAESANYIVADLSSLEGARHLAAETKRLFDATDVLVLNHAVFPREVWNKDVDLNKVPFHFAVNSISYINIATLLLPGLQKTNGSIVVMSSFAGVVSPPKFAVYSGSKHALHGFFGALRQDLVLQGNKGASMTLCILGAISTKNAHERAKGHKIQNGTLMFENVDDCAVAIIRGAALRKREIYFPWFLRIIEIAHFLFPNFIESVIQVLMNEKPVTNLWAW
ncbi:hydroxysteroid 11-beta-dehydrogenase 1-like protein isoform X1 [Montipora capricornis]|uniref:hydroxysteroid 11-beta-dehydrogenase 1-like protein isoform X1 n=1 Tax=Montipora capricornis TaxID=246305 RepID=UPI0035F1A6D9